MVRQKIYIGLILLAAFMLAACTPAAGDPQQGNNTPGGNTNGSTTTTQAAPQPVSVKDVPEELRYIFEIPSDPIQVTPSLDSERQAEALISTSGGTLNASGADGTTYRLDIPAGALVSETLVRMTPLSSLEGMPFGSERYAVQLEPEGLQFYEIAELTITPAQTLPVEQQIFFGYQGLGENLVLAPPVVGSSEIKIQVLHFSGYGVSKGLLADIEPVRARIGGEAEARLSSAIAEQLAKARQEQLLGIEDGTEIDWEGFFQQWEQEVVQPRIAAAGESCAAGRLAIQTILSYERQRQLLGMGESSTYTALIANGLMDTVAEQCMKEEYEMCRDDHIIHRIIPSWLGLERQAQLMGGSLSPAVLENARNYVKSCLSFELEFHSEGSFDGGEGDGYDSVVDAKVKLQLNPADMKMQSEAPLVNTEFEFRASGCKVVSNRGGDTFEVMNLSYIPDTKSPTDELGYVRDFNLTYYPGNTKETFSVSCPDSGTYNSPPTPMWTGIFLPLHQGEMSMSEGGFFAEDWEIFGDEYYAKKEWIKESSGDGIFEVGTFKLYHRPQ